jgi:hypothetical protein
LRKPFLKTGLEKNGKSKNVLFLAEKRIGRTKFAKKKKNSDKYSAFKIKKENVRKWHYATY